MIFEPCRREFALDPVPVDLAGTGMHPVHNSAVHKKRNAIPVGQAPLGKRVCRGNRMLEELAGHGALGDTVPRVQHDGHLDGALN